MAATADGDSGVALGHQAQASGTDSVAIGRTTRAFLDNSVSIGWGNISDSGQGWALGNRSTTRGINKAIVFGATHSDTDNGTEQFGLYSPRVTTTNATPTALTMDGVAPSLSNQNILVLADHSTYGFLARVVARDLATGESATWEIEGVAKKAAGAASVTQTSAVSPVTSDVGPAWSVAMVADTANGGIAVVVTGQAGRTIKWLAKIETVESVGGAN